MKTTSTSVCRLIGAILLIATTAGATYGANLPRDYFNVRYSVVVNKNLNNKKHKIRLYTDAGRENILFAVNGVAGKKYQLFIFDMDSRLVSQANTSSGEISVVNNISAGNYLFEVIVGDEEVESGQLSVK